MILIFIMMLNNHPNNLELKKIIGIGKKNIINILKRLIVICKYNIIFEGNSFKNKKHYTGIMDKFSFTNFCYKVLSGLRPAKTDKIEKHKIEF